MESQNCPVCGGHWIENQLFWATGKKGKDEDLNALVCRNLPPEKFTNCINPCKGAEGGVGWAERQAMVNAALDEFDL